MKALPNGNWKLVTAIFVLAITGCSVLPEAQVDLTRYYVMTGSGLMEQQLSAHDGALNIGLKMTQVAPYLDKGTVVVRAGTKELIFNDYARWAEPLSEGITRVIRGRLLASPSVDRVFGYPYPFEQHRDCDVSITVIRCEGVREAGRTLVRFSGLLEVTTVGDNSEVVARRIFTAPDREWDGRDYATLVQMLSESVISLADEVVAALPVKS
jgi:uncharacterized protein